MAVARLATNRRGWFRRGCSLPILLSNTRSTRSAFPEVPGLFLVTIIVRARHRSMFGQLHISVRLFTAHLYTQFGMVSSFRWKNVTRTFYACIILSNLPLEKPLPVHNYRDGVQTEIWLLRQRLHHRLLHQSAICDQLQLAHQARADLLRSGFPYHQFWGQNQAQDCSAS